MRNDIQTVARTTLQGLFGMSGIGDDLKAQWQAAIQDFQNQRAALDQAEQDLYGVFDLIIQGDATDSAEWGKNLDKVHSAKVAMDNIASAVATVADYWNRSTGYIADLSHDNVIYDAGNTVLQSVTGNPYDSIGTWIYNITHSAGMNGLRGISRSMRANGALGGLGLAPLVFPITLGVLLTIIGVAAAAVASVTAYITYVNTKKDRYSQLVADGVAPEDALKAATQEAQATSGYSFSASLQKIALYGLIAAVVVTVGPQVMRKFK